jgi:hypothetical protein
MQQKRIMIDVHTDGTIAATTKGITGPSCLDEITRIEMLCGGVTANSRLTDDYRATVTSTISSDQVEITEESP